jgi:excisionase family DNA binding protein
MDILRIGRSQCYSLLRKGKIKAFKIGKKAWKIPRESLEDYISSGISMV